MVRAAPLCLAASCASLVHRTHRVQLTATVSIKEVYHNGLQAHDRAALKPCDAPPRWPSGAGPSVAPMGHIQLFFGNAMTARGASMNLCAPRGVMCGLKLALDRTRSLERAFLALRVSLSSSTRTPNMKHLASILIALIGATSGPLSRAVLIGLRLMTPVAPGSQTEKCRGT